MSGRDYVTVVTGFARSGTSLLMQMLVAGGIRAYDPDRAIWPGFESPDPAQLPHSSRWVPSAVGSCVKVLEPLRCRLPRGTPYRFVAMRRNPREQARSHYKWLRVFDPTISARRADYRTLERSLREDFRAATELLERYPHSELLVLRFEDVLADPSGVAEQLDGFVGMLDVRAAAAQVRKRPPGCLPYLLEAELVSSLTPEQS